MDSSVMMMADLDAFKHLPYFKPLYTTIIKLQMQYLVEQLSENADEETLLLTTNPSTGTVSKLTSLHASGFLDHRSDLRAQFTKYCYESKQLTENARKRKHSKDSTSIAKKSKYIASRHDNGTAYVNATVFAHSEKNTNPGVKFKQSSDSKKHSETNISPSRNDSPISNIGSGGKSLVSDKTNMEDRPSDSSGQKSEEHVAELSAVTEDIDLAIVKKELDSDMDSADKFESRSGDEDNVEDVDVDSDLRNKTNDEITHDNHVADGEIDNVEDLNGAANVDTNKTRLDKKLCPTKIPVFIDDWTLQQSDMDSDSMVEIHENSDVYRSQNNSQNSQSDNISDMSLNSPIPFSHQLAAYQSQSEVLLTNAIGRFECSYCEQSFTTVSSKRRHERKHTGENPFACELCDQKFYRKDDLNVHIYKHKGYKPYSCHICQSGYVKRKMLEWHLASAHNITVSNTLP